MTTALVTVGVAVATILLVGAICTIIIALTSPPGPADTDTDTDTDKLEVQMSVLFTDNCDVAARTGGRHRPDNIQPVPANYLIPKAYPALYASRMQQAVPA